eukprot:403337514
MIYNETLKVSEIVFMQEEAEPTFCYETDLPSKVFVTGFWYELCFEIQSSFQQCEENPLEEQEQCVQDKLVYNSQMYYTQQIYLALKLQDSFRDRLLFNCQTQYQEQESNFTVSYKKFNKALSTLSLLSLYNDKNWKYEPREDCIQINNQYSFDMDLFYKEKDMRQLYRWDNSMEFLAICELASGDFPDQANST